MVTPPSREQKVEVWLVFCLVVSVKKYKCICVVCISVVGMCVVGMCVVGMCVVGTCVVGTCVVGTCVVGTCVVGTCVVGYVAICCILQILEAPPTILNISDVMTSIKAKVMSSNNTLSF